MRHPGTRAEDRPSVPGLAGFWACCHAPDPRSDPIGESEPVSGCETIYWDSFFYFFFYFFIIIFIQI